MSAAKSTSEQLKDATVLLAAALNLRDRLIYDRAGEGASLRVIAAEAGLSHTAVSNILERGSAGSRRP
jgi:AcrR family transcriptional regulator